MKLFETNNYFAKNFREFLRKKLNRMLEEIKEYETGLYILSIHTLPPWNTTEMYVIRFQHGSPITEVTLFEDGSDRVVNLIKSSFIKTREIKNKAFRLFLERFGSELYLIPESRFYFAYEFLNASRGLDEFIYANLEEEEVPKELTDTITELASFLMYRARVENWRDLIYIVVFLNWIGEIIIRMKISEHLEDAEVFFQNLFATLTLYDGRIEELLPEEDITLVRNFLRGVARMLPRRIPSDEDFLNFIKNNVFLKVRTDKGIVHSISLAIEKPFYTSPESLEYYFNEFAPDEYHGLGMILKLKDLEKVIKSSGFLRMEEHKKGLNEDSHFYVLKVNSFEDILLFLSIIKFGDKCSGLTKAAREYLAREYSDNLPKDSAIMFLKFAEACLKRRCATLAYKIAKKYGRILWDIFYTQMPREEARKLLQKYLVIPTKYAKKLPPDRFLSFLLTIVYVV